MPDFTRIKRLYGIEEADCAHMLATQNARCWLCLKKFNEARPWCVDHRHADGLVRGLICGPCNDKIGFLHEDAGWMQRAFYYLSCPPAPSMIGEHFVPGSMGEADRRERV